MEATIKKKALNQEKTTTPQLCNPSPMINHVKKVEVEKGKNGLILKNNEEWWGIKTRRRKRRRRQKERIKKMW